MLRTSYLVLLLCMLHTALFSQATTWTDEGEVMIEFTAEEQKGVVFLKSDVGEQVGFLVSIRDRTFIITSWGGIAGSTELEISSNIGRPIQYSEEMFGGEGSDILMIRPTSDISSLYTFELASDFENSVKPGDIVVAASTEGRGSLGYAFGNIQEISPELIKHDIYTYAKTSGAPVILAKSRKLIGMNIINIFERKFQWYNSEVFRARKQSDDYRETKAQRIDTITAWVPVRFSLLKEQHDIIEAFNERSETYYSFFQTGRGSYQEDQEFYSEYQRFAEELNSRKFSDIVVQSKLDSFVAKWKARANFELNLLKEADYYSVFKDEIETSIFIREEIIQEIENTKPDRSLLRRR